MARNPFAFVLLLSSVSGCQKGGSFVWTGVVDEASDWDDAELVVTSPVPGQFYELGEPIDFEAAVVRDGDNEMAFKDVVWTTDVDEWTQTGTSFQDESLTPATHNLLATADLPNGDHLVYAVSGILVQHPDAGTYVGQMQIDRTLTYQATDYVFPCIGSATVVVDIYGEWVVGDSTCIVTLLDMDSTYSFELENDDGEIDGTAYTDVWGLPVELPTDGTLGDGEVEFSWYAEIPGFLAVDAAVAATRISRDTTAIE